MMIDLFNEKEVKTNAVIMIVIMIDVMEMHHILCLNVQFCIQWGLK